MDRTGCLVLVQFYCEKPSPSLSIMGNGKRKASGGSGGSVKKRQAISMETKVAIIKKIDSGEKTMNVACLFNMSSSTICTVYKNKERIKQHVKSAMPMQSTIITKRRGKLIKEMEKFLGMWMEHHRGRRTLLSVKLIQEKAMSLFDDHMSVSGEAASADKVAAEKKEEKAKEIISSLVAVSEKLHLDLEEEDFEEPLESHEEKLTSEELMELEQMQRTEEHEEEEEPVPVKKSGEMSQYFIESGTEC